jgi:glucose/arabinose dehydrogenase
MQGRGLRIAAASVAAALAVSLGLPPRASAAVPQGFTDSLMFGVGSPTALAFTPDGRMLVTTQGGQLRVADAAGALLPTAAVTVPSPCTNSERGLLGVAVDPAFATNHFIYLYYTTSATGACRNRVSRWVLSDANLASGEVVLIDRIHSTAGNHNGGDLNFGADGMLYASVGDGGCDYATPSNCAGVNDAARDHNVLLGKILRIDRDGNIPASGNPFTGPGTGRCNVNGSTTPGDWCQETYAWGLRNPYRFAFDPNTPGRFYIDDVGQGLREEIDDGLAGADYGWNVREGTCANPALGPADCGSQPPAGMTNPIFDYGRSDGCVSITGGAFVPNGIDWPAEYLGKYLFSDYGCGKIFRLDPSAGPGFTRVDFATNLGSSSAVHLEFGPFGASQALYYTTYASGGQVRRISFTSQNVPPTAVIAATPMSGPAPLAVSFDGSGSSDPDPGDTIVDYAWTFGDGSPVLHTASPTASHTYAGGNYTASLRVTDNRGGISAPASVNISAGNTPPTASIDSPPVGTTFAVGQNVTVTGSGSDPQDPSVTLTWTVLRRHDTHTHPWASGTGSSITFPYPAPEDLSAVDNSWIEVYLTATDSGGLTHTASRNYLPRKVSLNLATSPAGPGLTLNGSAVTAPYTFTAWQGWVVTIGAPDQTNATGKWRFVSWSDGGAKTHTVTSPSVQTTYTATFRKIGKK